MQPSGVLFVAGTSGSDPARAAMKQELVREVLSGYGRVRIRVFGTSMLPALWPGDVLGIERTDGGEIGVGDIVLFERRGQLFAHRVVAVSGSGEQQVLLTQGDSISRTDPPFRASELLGRVEVVGRAGDEIPPERRPGAFSRAASWLFRRSGPLRRVSLALHSRYRRLAGWKSTVDARPESSVGMIYQNAPTKHNTHLRREYGLSSLR